MLKIKFNGEVMEFKNWREAHYELKDRCHSKDPECFVNRLEHYSDFETRFDDFGNEIGKECVECFPEFEGIIEDKSEDKSA
jgi:hypothetical protein